MLSDQLSALDSLFNKINQNKKIKKFRIINHSKSFHSEDFIRTYKIEISNIFFLIFLFKFYFLKEK